MDVSACTHPMARAHSHYIRHVSPTHIQPLAQSTHSPVRPHLLTQSAHARPPAHSPIHLPCPRTRPHLPASPLTHHACMVARQSTRPSTCLAMLARPPTLAHPPTRAAKTHGTIPRRRCHREWVCRLPSHLWIYGLCTGHSVLLPCPAQAKVPAFVVHPKANPCAQ